MTLEERNGSARGEGAERDPRLDRAYRAGAREEPPSHLDAAILAAAHREVGARPRPLSARLHAWRVPVSIAAVVVLSVSVVTLMREEGGGTLDQAQRPAPAAGAVQEQAKPEQPTVRNEAAASSAAAKVADEAKLRDSAASARRAEDSPRLTAKLAAEPSAKPEAQPPAPASPRPFPGAAPMRDQPASASSADLAAGASASSTVGIRGSSGDTASPVAPAEQAATGPAERSGQRERAAVGAGALSMDRPAMAPATPSSAKAEYRALKAEPMKRADSGRLAPLVKELETQPAEKWLVKIDALRREGRKDEAEELLAEFKRRFPDYPLPPVSGNP
jgi:hypothetical protein